MTAEDIGQVAYETHRAYSETLGDTSLVAWPEVTGDARAAYLDGITFQLECLGTGTPASPQQMHIWTGSSVPFGDLTDEDRMKYALLGAVVQTLYA